VDVLITNRLHGLVLGLKNSIPVVAVDPIAGGGKVTAQARALGWPILIPAEELSAEKLDETVRICLGRDLSPELERGHKQGQASISKTRGELMEILKSLTPKAL
jgi:polysaccharide pyruvyl transferase WcaK-like protein